MDRRVAVLAAFAGIVAMVFAWLLLGQGNGRRSRRDRVERPTVAAPVRVPAEHRAGSAELRPDLAEKLRPGRKGAGPTVDAPAPSPGGEAPAEGAPFPMDQDGIAAAVGARKADLQACYDTARYHTPGLAGAMTLVFAVVPDEGAATGHVQSVHVETDLDATVFEGCVVTVFQELRFATSEPTTVRYPLAFTEDGEEEAP